MKRFAMVWVGLVVLGLLGACHSGHAGGASGDSAAPPEGGTFYTQFSLFQENDRFPTSNYRRGLMLPVNTEVTLLDMNSRVAKVQLKSGRRLVVENIPKHTGETMQQAFEKVFRTSPVDLSRFSEAERKAILSGRAEVGMSRDAVLAAIGYPPATGTPTLDSGEWKYWNSRWTTFVVRFDDGGHVVKVGR